MSLHRTIPECIPTIKKPSKVSLIIDAPLLQSHKTALGTQRLAELILLFGESSFIAIQQLKTALENQDNYKINEEAHRFADNEESIGATVLAEKLRKIEVACESNQPICHIMLLIKSMESIHKKTLVELKFYST
ncbi:hypothetical protein [Marinomonas sp. 2405UD68-3]|uniref:hypothetical protein n=1 Tax=Marinomonas sp. 2405UD68-3 TaxID=3391835 RepID=UPI0039C9F142